jgi:hypothetical protein
MNEPYPYLQAEEAFIRFLLEKVIMMRELPYMKASLSLERNLNLDRIFEKA